MQVGKSKRILITNQIQFQLAIKYHWKHSGIFQFIFSGSSEHKINWGYICWALNSTIQFISVIGIAKITFWSFSGSNFIWIKINRGLIRLIWSSYFSIQKDATNKQPLCQWAEPRVTKIKRKLRSYLVIRKCIFSQNMSSNYGIWYNDKCFWSKGKFIHRAMLHHVQ